MIRQITFVGNSKTQNNKRNDDDSVFSKNHSKSVRYRLRQQQEQEAENEIKEYDYDKDEDAGKAV